jgi:hypothetical protein
MNSIILQILAVVIPVIAGFIGKELSMFTDFVNGLPAVVQGLIAVAVAFGASALAGVLGISLPGDLAGFDQNVIAAILTAAAQLLLGVPAAAQRARLARGMVK